MKNAIFMMIFLVLGLSLQAQLMSDYSMFYGYAEMTLEESGENMVFEMYDVGYQEDYFLYEFSALEGDFELTISLENNDPTLGIGLYLVDHEDGGEAYGGALASWEYDLEMESDYFQFTVTEPVAMESMSGYEITLAEGSGGSVIFYP